MSFPLGTRGDLLLTFQNHIFLSESLNLSSHCWAAKSRWKKRGVDKKGQYSHLSCFIHYTYSIQYALTAISFTSSCKCSLEVFCPGHHLSGEIQAAHSFLLVDVGGAVGSLTVRPADSAQGRHLLCIYHWVYCVLQLIFKTVGGELSQSKIRQSETMLSVVKMQIQNDLPFKLNVSRDSGLIWAH